MRFVKCFELIAAAILAGPISASTINVPNIVGDPPVIDGKMAPGEWDCASASLICKTPSGDFSNPNGRFYIARKGNDLYIAFVTDSMDRMPVSKAVDRDGKVWEDDAFELYLQAGGATYQFIVNAAGTIYDSKDPKNGDASWNGPWKVATSLIGTEYAVGYPGGERPKRGFVVEAMLPMDKAGIPLPSDGDTWGLQVAFDQVRTNPQALWEPMGDLMICQTMGRMVWGGAANQLAECHHRRKRAACRVSGRFRRADQLHAVQYCKQEYNQECVLVRTRGGLSRAGWRVQVLNRNQERQALRSFVSGGRETASAGCGGVLGTKASILHYL